LLLNKSFFVALIICVVLYTVYVRKMNKGHKMSIHSHGDLLGGATIYNERKNDQTTN